MAPKKKITISFSGCGFMGVYYAGVASCFREFEDHIVIERAAGTSGGAITAALYLSGICLGKCMTDVLKLACAARAGPVGPLSPRFDLVRSLRHGLLKLLPKDAHIKCSGRLAVSLTRCRDGKNLLVTQYDTLEDLVQVLLCSSFVPFYSGLVPLYYKDGRYWDGGMTNNMPTYDASTVTVSPFSGECDICPVDHSMVSLMEVNAGGQTFRINSVNVYRMSRALFPPHPNILKDICEEGYKDALRYIKRTLYECAGPPKYIVSEPAEPPIMEEIEEIENAEALSTVGMRTTRSDSVVQLHSVLEKYTPNTVNLPANIVDALHEASASAQHPILRALSMAAIPWLLPIEFMYSTCVRLVELAPRPNAMELQYYIEVFSSIAQRVVTQLLTRHAGHGSNRSWMACNCQVEAIPMSGSRCVIHGKAAISNSHSLTFAFAIVEDGPQMGNSSSNSSHLGSDCLLDSTPLRLPIQTSASSSSNKSGGVKLETSLLTAAIRCEDGTQDTLDYGDACDIVESFERQVADYFREQINNRASGQPSLLAS